MLRALRAPNPGEGGTHGARRQKLPRLHWFQRRLWGRKSCHASASQGFGVAPRCSLGGHCSLGVATPLPLLAPALHGAWGRAWDSKLAERPLVAGAALNVVQIPVAVRFFLDPLAGVHAVDLVVAVAVVVADAAPAAAEAAEAGGVPVAAAVPAAVLVVAVAVVLVAACVVGVLVVGAAGAVPAAADGVEAAVGDLPD